MKQLFRSALVLSLASWGCTIPDTGHDDDDDTTEPAPTTPGPTVATDTVVGDAAELVVEGRETFRYDTFGDEVFWGETLLLHEAIAGEANGGQGDGVSPNLALSVGLKVDLDALPDDLVADLEAGLVDLDDPATTLALLDLDAVVGVTGFFEANGTLGSMGIQCALCHSTVDDAFIPGVGHRLDGWANRDLNVGAIIALAPDLTALTDLLGVDDATVRDVLNLWGPGKFDAQLVLDGKAVDDFGVPHPTLIPPAFGLTGVNLHTWTGWGSVPYWNAFVAIIEMGGIGNFYDPRLDDAVKFPVAAANGFGHITVDEEDDRVSPKLAGLQMYQLSLLPPAPPDGSFDEAAAERGDELFAGKAGCIACHVEPAYTEPGWNLHTAEEMGIDDFQAMRSPDEAYRTAPLRGLWSHTTGGFYHDGRFATLEAVVDHYDSHFALGLTADEKVDLVEYLKSL